MFSSGGASEGYGDLQKELSLNSPYPPERSVRDGIGALDPVLLIYTRY